MDINVIDAMLVPVIVVASICIGYVIKQWLPTDNKWIPTILFIFGAISGAILFGLNYEGIVKGTVSGLAAVGLHQAFKQHLNLDMDDDELLAMGKGYEDIDEDDESDPSELEEDDDFEILGPEAGEDDE